MGLYRPQRLVTSDEPQVGLSPSDLLKFAAKENLKLKPLDVEGVARRLGLIIERSPMDDDISGYIERRGARWWIGVNSLQHPNRQRFTVAHELGHYVLHRNQFERRVDKILFRNEADRNDVEWQANDFAAKLLMPEDAVRAEIRSGTKEVEALARKFAVSSLAMHFRLQNLGYRISG